MNELAKSYVIRFGLPKSNPYLSPTDYVYSKVKYLNFEFFIELLYNIKVSTFHELVSSVVQAGDQAMAMLDSSNSKAQVIIEVIYTSVLINFFIFFRLDLCF